MGDGKHRAGSRLGVLVAIATVTLLVIAACLPAVAGAAATKPWTVMV